MEVNLANFVDHVLAFKCDEAKTPADQENAILNTYIYNAYIIIMTKFTCVCWFVCRTSALRPQSVQEKTKLGGKVSI